MLKSFSLKNFKAFGSLQKVPLRPITLVFGPNSAGKSSLIHSLLLAQHAVTTGELDVHFPGKAGDSVDLGGFRQYVYKGKLDNPVEFVLDFNDELLGTHLEATKRFSGELSNLSVSLIISAPLDDKGAQKSEPRLHTYSILSNNELMVRMTSSGDGYAITRINIDGVVNFISLKADSIINEWDEEFEIIGEEYQKTSENKKKSLKVQKLSSDYKRLATTAIESLYGNIEIISPSKLLIPSLVKPIHIDFCFDDDSLMDASSDLATGCDIATFHDYAKKYFASIFQNMLGEISLLIENELSRLLYLGPLRSYPQRHLAFEKYQDPNWLSGGGKAWEVVKKNSKIREQVNSWLGSEFLKTNYELYVKYYVNPESAYQEISEGLDEIKRALLSPFSEGGDLATFDEVINEEAIFEDDFNSDILEHDDENEEDASDYESERSQHDEVHLDIESNWNDDTFTNTIIENLLRKKEAGISELVLKDLRTKANVTHRDVGVGISQILPVLVLAFSSKGKIIAIEQPEIHLHPALQAEMAELFINSSINQNNKFILETHSEHLILRILKRIRRTSEGRLESGEIPLTPDQVQIVYANPTEDGAELYNIPITKDGDFARKWPEGFFSERAKELF